MAGKQVSVTIGQRKKTRSQNQNRYMWGVLIPAIQRAMREEGNLYTPEDIHYIMKIRLGFYRLIELNGFSFKVAEPTRTMSTKDFMAYVEIYQSWALENLGIRIPDPNEVDYD